MNNDCYKALATILHEIDKDTDNEIDNDANDGSDLSIKIDKNKNPLLQQTCDAGIYTSACLDDIEIIDCQSSKKDLFGTYLFFNAQFQICLIDAERFTVKRCDDAALKQIFSTACLLLNHWAKLRLIVKILVEKNYVFLMPRVPSRDGWGKLQYYNARDKGIDYVIKEIQEKLKI